MVYRVESGNATGGATDWMEDLMLRTATPDKYDQGIKWPFNSPEVLNARKFMAVFTK